MPIVHLILAKIATMQGSICRIKIALFILVVGVAAIAQDASPQRQWHSQAKPKIAIVYVEPGSVLVGGVWRPDNPNKQNELIEAVSSLSCSRYGGKEIVGTDAWCLEAQASAPYGMLTVGTSWLKVVEWSNSQIIATDDSADCITVMGIFDLKNKTVVSVAVRKPDHKGLNGACDLVPDRQTYYLQDTADYYTMKELHSK